MLLIWLVGFFVFTFGPTIASIYLSFTDYDLARPPLWVGWENYVRIVTDDPKFRESMHVTLVYVLFSVPLETPDGPCCCDVPQQGTEGLVHLSRHLLLALIAGEVWRLRFSGVSFSPRKA